MCSRVGSSGVCWDVHVVCSRVGSSGVCWDMLVYVIPCCEKKSGLVISQLLVHSLCDHEGGFPYDPYQHLVHVVYQLPHHTMYICSASGVIHTQTHSYTTHTHTHTHKHTHTHHTHTHSHTHTLTHYSLLCLFYNSTHLRTHNSF